MPPNSTQSLISDVDDDGLEKLVAPQAGPRQYKVTWSRVILFAYLHIAAVYGLYLLSTAKWQTVIFNCFTYYLSIVCVSAGTHRLWTHRSFKATKPLEFFLMLGHCLAGQHAIFIWVKDHRLHHRYSDTDADPYNPTRGFFYAHIGWTLVDRHPIVKKRSRMVDMSDMEANPIIMFQKRHRTWLMLLLAGIIPTLVPIYFWNESFLISYHINIFRVILCINATLSINSVAHVFGSRPYDKNLMPTQNFFIHLFTLGEGFHNYHHAFPYDYRSGELGTYMNFATSFINICKKLGLAYNLKAASKEVIEQRMARTGDGSKDTYGFTNNSILNK